MHPGPSFWLEEGKLSRAAALFLMLAWLFSSPDIQGTSVLCEGDCARLSPLGRGTYLCR